MGPTSIENSNTPPETVDNPDPEFSLALSDLPNGSAILFQPGPMDLLTINFTSGNLTEVRLFLNGIDFGTVTPGKPTSIAYSGAIDGPVNFELRGFYNEQQVIVDCRNVTFGKIVSQTLGNAIDSGILSVPHQLYFILHDPAGDGSNSSITVANIEYNIALLSLSETIGNPTVNTSLCTTNSFLYPESSQTPEFEWKYREPGSSFSIGSCISTNNRNIIGPVRGDTYHGISWVLEWQLYFAQAHYFNGTDASEWKISYGLRQNQTISVREGVYLPSGWCALNPLNQPGSTIKGAGKLIYYAGGMYSRSQSNVRLPVVNQSLTIETSATARQAHADLPECIPLALKTNLNGTITIRFTIFDNDGGDKIVQSIGIDPTYGTYIFSCAGNESYTSNPHEIGTVDRTAPYFSGMPDINYDTNGDGFPYRPLDHPSVTVKVYEDGVLASVRLTYSIDNGANWENVDMRPDPYTLDRWYGYLPCQPQGTSVLWYINATNEQGLSATLNYANGVPFSYKVLNSNPSITLTDPNGGETIQGTFLVTWTASDPDNDILTFNLAYNIQNTGWVSLATGVSGTSYLWDTTALGSSSSVSIRVRGYDGYGGEGEDDSYWPFTIIPP